MNRRQADKIEQQFNSGLKKIEDRQRTTPQERLAILKRINASPSHKDQLVHAIMTGLKLQAQEAKKHEHQRKNQDAKII